MKILGILLLLCTGVVCQVKIAQSPDAQFYIFPDSVFRTEDTILFTANYKKPKMWEFSTFIANCRTRTFLVVASEVHNGKNVTYYFADKRAKSLLAAKNSAIDITLNTICAEKVLPIVSKP